MTQLHFFLCFALLCLICISHSFPIHELEQKLKGILLTNNEQDQNLQKLYNDSIYIDNGAFQKRPNILVLPIDARDVQETIRFSQKYNASLTVKGGGHSAVGYCLNENIVLDMRYVLRNVASKASS